MSCRHAEDLLERYADQEVTEAQRVAVQAHLAGCASCQVEYSALLAVRHALEAHPRINASRDFDMRVLDAVMTQNARPHSFLYRIAIPFVRPLGELLEVAAMGAVLSLITVGIVLLPQLLPHSAARPAPPASRTTSSISLKPYAPHDFARFYAFNDGRNGIYDFKSAREWELFEAMPPATKDPS